MDHDFWHHCWENNDIGFHEGSPNQFLISQFSYFKHLLNGYRIFLPLCGKTSDIQWLLDQNYSVVGAELSQIAIDELFLNLNIQPTITQMDHLIHYHSKNIDIFVGDIFDLDVHIIGQIHGVYDRAALVALPPKLRLKYANHLQYLTSNAPQFLIVFDYNQALMTGPPFSISTTEINQLYSTHYKIHFQESKIVSLKTIDASETVWFLTPK